VGRTASAVGRVAIVWGCLLTVAGARSEEPAAIGQRLQVLEQAIAADAEDLKVAADYRQLAIGAGAFDRAIDFLGRVAGRKGSGPNSKISLALAYVDKVPSAGDVRRLYLGRDAITALTQSIGRRPSVLAYYVRGVVNLYYNRFIFHRTDKGVADLTEALAMVTDRTPPALVARIYAALGDGYFRLENRTKAREVWSAGAAAFPGDGALRSRLDKQGQELEWLVGAALSADRRVDTSLTGLLPAR